MIFKGTWLIFTGHVWGREGRRRVDIILVTIYVDMSSLNITPHLEVEKIQPVQEFVKRLRNEASNVNM